MSTAKLAAGAVTAGQIAAGAVTAAALAANSVSAGKIATDAVTAGKIAADTVTAREIKALSITADKIATNSITADKIAAGSITAAALAADAIDGRTIKGVTITGGTIQTGQSGRRVLLSPVDPTDNSASPSTLLYSGAAAEKAPARLTAMVQDTPDGSAPSTQLTAPQITTDNTHTSRLLLSSGGPATGYAARGRWALDVYGPGNIGGQAMIIGTAGTATDAASVETSVRRATGSYKTALTHLDPESWFVQTADQVAAMYLSSSGLLIKALAGEVLLQTGSGLRLQGGNVDVGYGQVVSSATWGPITFKNGTGQLASWRRVTIKRLPDGTVKLRGIVSVPSTFSNGVIGTIDDTSFRPKEGEVFPAATANNVGANLFVYANGDVAISNATGALGGWVSFGNTEWCAD